MKRRWVIAMLLAACAEPSVPTGDDSLIAMIEGATVTRRVARTSSSKSSWDVTWASVSGDTLTLTPGCDVVAGTSGAPVIVALDHADGDRTLVVQVAPSREGDCLPRVLACIEAPDNPCLLDEQFSDASLGGQSDRLVPDFCPGPNCIDGDAQLHFRLRNPDVGDTTVSGRITTDAPIVFLDEPKHLEPYTETNPVDVSAVLYNANIAGDFRITYEVARDMSSNNVFARGAYQLGWNRNPLGLDHELCFSSMEGERCEVRRDPTLDGNGKGCIYARVSSSNLPATGQLTIALRIWITNGLRELGDSIHLRSEGVTFTAQDQPNQPTTIIVQARHADRVSLFANIGSSALDTEVLFRAWPCRSSAMVPGSEALCEEDDPLIMADVTELRIRVRAALANCALP